MDYMLDACDEAFLNQLYPESMPADNAWRQAISLFVIMNVGGMLFYLIAATLSYYFVFDHALLKHPHFLKDQV